MTPREFLQTAYAQLHPNRQPYSWQEQLFDRIVLGDFPPAITAPTGSGKTTMISLWLIALAWQARYAPTVTIPRRLVWVVNRRVVVDQATGEANALRQRIEQAPEVRDALASLCLKTNEHPLAISTLRGEFADNREWVKDPTRPAIIVGTVDMVGSRLLFSGYGDSFKTRAHHAGLLGQDTLLVNDEAHLTHAFASLISQVARRTGSPAISLSATLNGDSAIPFPPSFDEDLRRNGEFSKRFRAPKWLRLHEASNNRHAQNQAVEIAVQGPAPRTIIFVTRPEDAAAIGSQLRKRVREARVLVLTGTQRGDYRDSMAKSPVFADFTSNNEPSEPCWLVSTAAGEVGLDASCTRLITFLDTAEHVIQRLGRLNRFGETVGDAHLVYVPPKEKQEREIATLGYFRSLPSAETGVYDASAKALFEHRPPAEAVTEPPPEAPLTDWAVDRWSLTTSGRETKPKVESWLHGKQENLAETYVAWREDISLLITGDAPMEEIAKALQIHPLRAAELLREPTYRLLKKLEGWTVPNGSAILRPDGTVDKVSAWDYEALAYSTLILPPDDGGLEDGMFTTSAANGDDVADRQSCEESPTRARFLAKPPDESYTISDLLDADTAENISGREEIQAFLKRKGLAIAYMVELPAEDGAEPEILVYGRKIKAPDAKGDVLLCDHQRHVAEFARGLAQRLRLDPDLQNAFHWTGLHHDSGKAKEVWRHAMNCQDGEPLAKTGRRRTRPRLLGGFRHELASLGEARNHLGEVSEEHRDLALHLIACHHGHARPYFRGNACGAEIGLAEASREATLRFARLQERYGPWKLAYFEALFRAADWLASEGFTTVPEEPQDD